MLNILRQIVQEVNEAQDVREVLDIMVARVSETINVEACSVYLVDKRHNHYRLTASVGFNEGIKDLTIRFKEGLVGLVGEREEPINLEEAHNHPRYQYFPETGEERYKAFLGTPIIHQRQLIGILVIQQRASRCFDEGEEAFLVTVAAQLSGLIAHAQVAGTMAGEDPRALRSETMTLQGSPAANGVAIGHAVVRYASADLDGVIDRKITDIESEIGHFKKAVKSAQSDIQRLSKQMINILPPEELSLFDAYLRILESQSLQDEIIALIKKEHWAPWALRKVIKSHIRSFEAMEDIYLRERATDLLDLGRRILSHLQKENTVQQTFLENTILVGDEITASTLVDIPPDKLKAIVSAKGSSNSHVAILARAMGIPAVMGTNGLPISRIDGSEIIVDGYYGEVYISPTEAMREEFERLVQEEKELYAGLHELRELRAETPDGVRIPLNVNTGLVADIRGALQVGAEGVGLYRTEVPFMIRDRFPSEKEQYSIYRQLLESFYPKPVVVRTLDVGGDKSLPYFPVKEDNPFLGWRGIRITLDHPEIFLQQLRALMRANSGLNNLKLLLPMISCVSEVDESLRLIRQAHQEVVEEGAESEFPKVGVMIEVPSAIYQIEKISKRVDFLSVGSNDLTQYLLAVDRSNSNVANLYESLHPSVLAALKAIVDGAQKMGKPVSICGEMAGDPASVLALLGLGFDMLSMNARDLPKIKWVIRNFTLEYAHQLLKEALAMDSGRQVRRFFEGALEDAGLGGLVRAGK